MNVTKEEELLALGAALYLLGLEVEASQSRLSRFFDNGLKLCSPEIMEENKTFNRLSLEFCRLEERFLALEKEIKEES